MSSILEKASEENIVEQYASTEEVSDLERILYRLPEIVENALHEYAPNYIATYLVEVARAFNSFYADHKIIDTSDKETSAHRVAIAHATQIVLRNGLGLLGITAPDRM